MKPDPKMEDPNEVEALKKAQASMGDYKLKTASDYVVPEHQRVTTESKRRQLVLLRKQVCTCVFHYIACECILTS